MDMLNDPGPTYQRRLAERLRKTSDATTVPQAQMVGGHWIAPSIFGYLNQATNDIGATLAERAAQRAEREQLAAQTEHAQQWRRSLPQAVAGRAAIPENYVMQAPEDQAGVPGVEAQPLTADRVLRHALAAAAGNPLLKDEAAAYAKYGMQDVEARQRQEAAAAEKAANRGYLEAEAERRRIETGEQKAADKIQQDARDRERRAFEERMLGQKQDFRISVGDGGKQDAAKWRNEDTLSKQYDALTKDARTELEATRKLNQLAPTMIGRRPNAIEQQTMIVLLNKFLDPTSVVREGEFDRVAQAQGYVQRAQNLANRIANGELMSDVLIKQIVDMGTLYEKAAKTKLQSVGDLYHDKAVKRGLDPSAVLVDPNYRPASAAPVAPAPKGAVREVKR